MLRRYPVGVDWRLQRHPVWRGSVFALLGFLALAAWAFSSPAGSSPDDDYHLTSIWCAQGERAGLCEDITDSSVSVPDNVVHAPCFAFNKDISGACQQNLSTELVEMGRANNLEHSYPPGFYWAMSWFAGPDVTLSVLLMRLFNAALFVSMAAATFILIEPKWRQPLAVGMAVTIVPLGVFIIPSTNPSSWTLYAPAFVFLLVRSMLRARDRGRVVSLAATVLATLAIASSARSDAAVFTVFAIALAALTEWRAWFKRPAFYAVAAGSGGISLASLLMGRQTGAASGGLNEAATEAGRGSLALLARNIIDLPGLLIGSLGTWNLGWLDTPMPSMVWVSMLIAFGSVVIAAICFKASLRELWAPGIAFAMLCAVPLAISQSSASPIGSYVQPRYVLPLLALSTITLLTTQSERFDINLRQREIAFILVTVAFVIALATNNIRYTIGMETSKVFDGLIGLAPTALGSASALFFLLLELTGFHGPYESPRSGNSCKGDDASDRVGPPLS